MNNDFYRSKRPRNRGLFLVLFLAGFACLTGCARHSVRSELDSRQAGIEDFLLNKLSQTKMMAIPDFNHDSLDPVRLPMKLIKRWQKKDYGIKKLMVGLETETNLEKFSLLRQNRFHQFQRFATIASRSWGMVSSREVSWLLFLKGVLDEAKGRFGIFGFENSYHYYDPQKKTYLLPNQVNPGDALEKIPGGVSQAPFAIKYAYSRFFRDFMSFSTIMDEVQQNPDACFLIIIGSGHTIKKLKFNENDEKWIAYHKIDKSVYTHPLGYFLKDRLSASFVQTVFKEDIKKEMKDDMKKPVLFKYNPDRSGPSRLESYFTDYCYVLPRAEEGLLEEVPLLVVPSSTNLSLLKNKNFQLYFKDEYIKIAKKIIYLMTGIVPAIKEQHQEGDAVPCTFVNPETNEPLDYDQFVDRIKSWYLDGTYLKRIREDLAGHNHRSLFKAIFSRMNKTDFSKLSEEEGDTLIQYLFALLTVIGTEEEQALARSRLAEKLGPSSNPYGYFKLFYGID